MSETTGFTTGGFFPRDPITIERDYEIAASGVLEEINYGPGDPLYQIFKVTKLREYAMELLVQQMTSGLSVYTAYGDFLDKHGESRGVFRKGKQKAGGYVQLSFEPPGAGSYYELYGTQYLSKNNLLFERSDSGTTQIYRYIPITRGVANIDYLSEPYVWITGVGYINNQSDGSGGSDWYPVWNQTYQYFNWSGIASQPNAGETFYVEVTGTSRIKDDISAYEEGTGYNVGANTIDSFTNNASLPTNTTINNAYSITGGSISEIDNDYRERILRRINGKYTLNEIRSRAESLVGVRAAHVYQDVGDDRTSVSGNWSETITSYDSGIIITGTYTQISGGLWSQRFSPGEGIMSLKKTVFRGYRIGYPPPLIVGLRNIVYTNYDYTGVFDTFEVIPPASTIQDMTIKFDYLDLSSLETYALEFWCGDKSGASGAGFWNENYWTIITGAMSGNLGDGDAYTGLLIDPTGASAEANSIFKTQYGSAMYNIDLAIKDGYSFSEISNVLDSQLDWVEGSGYAPVGIDYSINEALPVNIYYEATLYIKKDATSVFNTIVDRVDYSVEKYIEGLYPGENVVFSEMYYNIMDDPEVWRIDELKIYESGGSALEDEDIYIAEGEVSYFAGSTLIRG